MECCFLLAKYSFHEQQNQLHSSPYYVLKLSVTLSKEFHESDSGRERTVPSAESPKIKALNLIISIFLFYLLSTFESIKIKFTFTLNSHFRLCF